MRSQIETQGAADRETAAERMLSSSTASADALAAVCVCDANGQIVQYNERAAALWGRAPKAGDPGERFCGSHRMYRPDGSPLQHAKCAVAEALHRGVAIRNTEVVIERPDGSRSIALVNVEPLTDAAGKVTGAVSWLHDITDRIRSSNGQQVAQQHLPGHMARYGDPLRGSEPRPGNALDDEDSTSSAGIALSQSCNRRLSSPSSSSRFPAMIAMNSYRPCGGSWFLLADALAICAPVVGGARSSVVGDAFRPIPPNKLEILGTAREGVLAGNLAHP